MAPSASPGTMTAVCIWLPLRRSWRCLFSHPAGADLAGGKTSLAETRATENQCGGGRVEGLARQQRPGSDHPVGVIDWSAHVASAILRGSLVHRGHTRLPGSRGGSGASACSPNRGGPAEGRPVDRRASLLVVSGDGIARAGGTACVLESARPQVLNANRRKEEASRGS